ncbi:hypothetical protein D5086_033184 [Populus alba]|uniref:Dof-type domain-containing protein n=3 Tax=Populus TaxID=3689 RepID=A0A4U5Q156_POPAL|nr:cyclic dof factor 3-like [Populus alba]KAJ6951833.1 cyclic dof factor 3-like [Populus alba x Populus x berolinensis]TKS01715.1 hypothetical protein D5086_0000170400 [Populus alba]
MKGESKDPAFKLFGRKIPVPDTQFPAEPLAKGSCNDITKLETKGPGEENSEEPEFFSALGQGEEEIQAAMQVNETEVIAKPKEGQLETNGTDKERVFKKPDKILPCPRCNSLDTKFCYFNNYNVNQPRHFCKNCQRYWTAGGTMRNVPIGAGRRKNKHLATQYHQILVSSDGMPIARMENSDSAGHQLSSSVESATTLSPSTANGTVLKFGPEAPLCDSMETVLNLGDPKRYVETSSVNYQDNGEEPPSRGSSKAAFIVCENELPENIMQEQVDLPASSNNLSAPHSLLCYSVPSWVFPWNPSWNNDTSMAAAQYSSGQACMTNVPTQVQLCPTPMLAVPSICPPNIPLQFVPASYWSCMPPWTAGTGNVPPCGSNGCLSPSSSTTTSYCSGNGSPKLGKHSRDSKFMDEEKTEKCILVPKTLRIDDPSEASKSPLWATFGLPPDQKDPTSEGCGHVSDATNVLEANPAALSRSQTFQESG